MLDSCKVAKDLNVTVYETSAQGNSLQKITEFSQVEKPLVITLNPDQKFQTITGFGGAFTESSAHLLYKLSPANRKKIMDAYFSEGGANYSLTRTHINSCDFSLKHYAYDMVDGDKNLDHFSIEEDKKNNLIPMILEAKSISKEGFNIIASPWTAPPWMKDNKKWVGGKLLPEYNDTWALYFSKYIDAYKKEGITIWGLTVENEPHGNGNNWESMLFSPDEMTSFVQNHLGPKLEADGKANVKILGYDQNRAGIKEWVDAMYKDEKTSKYYAGTAVHWYESTYEVFPDDLQYAHQKAPNKYLIQTEACVDSEIPHWNDDAWYWKKEATDWGWDWASENDKYLHPKYAPVNRYANDIIGCIDWVAQVGRFTPRTVTFKGGIKNIKSPHIIMSFGTKIQGFAICGDTGCYFIILGIYHFTQVFGLSPIPIRFLHRFVYIKPAFAILTVTAKIKCFPIPCNGCIRFLARRIYIAVKCLGR